MKKTILLWVSIILFGILLCASQGPLSLATEEAELIVVGSAEDGVVTQQGVRYTIRVVRTLKGDATTGSAFPVDVAIRKDPRLGPPPSSIPCGIWMLRSADGGWSVLKRGMEVGASSFHYPLPSCAAAPDAALEALTVTDKVAVELASALHVPGADKSGLLRSLFRELNPGETPLVRELSLQWRSSPSDDIRTVGLAWGIVLHEPEALSSAAREMSKLAHGGLGSVLITALHEYANLDATGIGALGQITQMTDLNQGNALLIRKAAAKALRRLHTREALPHLYALLDDSELRENAIAGFSYFRMGVPPFLPGVNPDEALQRVAPKWLHDPANQAERPMIRLDPIREPAEEQALAQLWKQWFQQNRGALGL